MVAIVNDSQVIAGRFELEAEVHAGSMARVFLARDRQALTSVALKIPIRDDEVDMSRFRREADILESLQHSGIVRHVAHDTTSYATAYLATEWIEGETLFARLMRGQLSIADSVFVALRVAEALAIVHRAG